MMATRNGLQLDASEVAYRDNIVVELPAGGIAFLGGLDAGGNFSQ